MSELYLSHINPLVSKIATYSTEDVLKLWDETESQIMSIDNANVRDAIMRVLESRHNKEFTAWMNADVPYDDIHIYFKGVQK